MDSILFWNDVALEANRVSFTNGANEQPGPPLSVRALAIVHLAMYDAFAAVVRSQPNPPVFLTSHLTNLPTVPANSSKAAAVTGAAYTALVKLFPAQKAFFDFILAATDDFSSPGFGFGKQVAELLLADRGNDPDASDRSYVPPVGVGKHKKDPDNPGQDFHGPFNGSTCKTFAVTARPPFRLDLPPTVGDSDYKKSIKQARHYNQEGDGMIN